MKKVFLFHFILPFVFFSTIYSQVKFEEPNTTKIYIKPSDREINTRVISVASYGIILENEETVSYKVISKIVTNNSKLIDSILTFVPNASTSSSGNDIVLNMQNAVYEKPVSADNRVIQDKVLLFNIFASKTENLGITLNFSPRILDIIYIQLGFSSGRFSGKHSYDVTNASIEIGKKSIIPAGEVLMGLGICEKILNISSRINNVDRNYKNDTKTVAYLGLAYRFQPNKDLATLSVGIKYFLSNVSVFEDDSNLSFSLGMGINLSGL